MGVRGDAGHSWGASGCPSQGHTTPTEVQSCRPFSKVPRTASGKAWRQLGWGGGRRRALGGHRSGHLAVGTPLRLFPFPSPLPRPRPHRLTQELEKCEANHYIILFRDAGCQFRALYCYYPDSEEICKLTGTGPRSISKKMIDKLYKYSSDRKQFSLIPAKTMSVSVDALTIHNHLWQPKRPAAPKKTQVRK